MPQGWVEPTISLPVNRMIPLRYKAHMGKSETNGYLKYTLNINL